MEPKTINVDFSKQEDVTSPITSIDVNSGKSQEFINQKFMEAFALKKHVTAAPTYTPKNFFEQTVYYKNGATIRRYDYIDGAWHYVVLT